MTTRRLGILGGTFDPIHCGHLDAGEAANAALDFTEIWVVPSNTPPHRPQPVTSSYHRFAMVALAVAGRPRWRASDIELGSAEPSFTSATLDSLHAAGYTPWELFFIVGADAFAEIGTWKDYPAIVNRAHFAVVSRPGLAAKELSQRLPALASRMITPSLTTLQSRAPAVFLIEAATADVSSTEIRRRRAAGQSITGLVPPAVEGHIEQHSLYGLSGNTPMDADLRDVRTDGTAGGVHGQN